MTSVAERWEHGSHFHSLSEEGEPELPWRDGAVRLHGSGRHSLVALLGHVAPARLLAPRYYCPEVFEAVRSAGIELVLYDDSPSAQLVAPVQLRAGDVWLRCNTLGLRGAAGSLVAPKGVIVVDDHSHDLLSPWARAADAHYAFASLRKTLPLPDGGALWSPRGLALPAEAPSVPEHERAARERLRAMELKAQYLAGDAVTKEEFYGPLAKSEAALGLGAVAAMTSAGRARLVRCPTRRWRERRAQNFVALREVLSGSGSEVLEPGSGAVPFVLTLVSADPAQRERLRAQLIARRVYPAVLWALDAAEVGALAAGLAARVLCIQVDQRYDVDDMLRVGAVVREALATCR